MVEWGELRRSRRLSRISFGANPSPKLLTTPKRHPMKRNAGTRTLGSYHRQVVARPQASSPQGRWHGSRVDLEGEPIGPLDVNAPEGNGIPWHFRTAAFEEHGSNGEARAMLHEAKAAAAFYAGMKSRATRDEKARARQIALTKLKQGTPEGLEDLASHTIRSRTVPPRSPITSHRKSTLVIEDVSPDEGWALAVKSPTAFQLPRWRAYEPARHGERGPQGLGRRVQRHKRPRGAEPGQRTCLELAFEEKKRRRRSIREVADFALDD